jgi:hypothetical protein
MGMIEQDILGQVEKGLSETNRRLGEVAEQLRQLTAAVRSATPASQPHAVSPPHPDVDTSPRPQF